MTPQTVRLTVAQAVVTYLSRQYSVADGERRRLKENRRRQVGG